MTMPFLFRRRRFTVLWVLAAILLLCLYQIIYRFLQDRYTSTMDVIGREDVVNFSAFFTGLPGDKRNSNMTESTKPYNDSDTLKPRSHEDVFKSYNRSDVLKQLDTGSPNCHAAIYPHQPAVKTPYKIYIYDLPPRYNKNLIQCRLPYQPHDFEQCGFGPTMSEENDVVFTKNWQFSLDIMIHHKLMFSPYRTFNPEEADVFFIPLYEATHCFCMHRTNTTLHGQLLENALFDEIQTQPYYRQGKPHVLIIAKIEREEMSPHCSLLRQEWTWNTTVIGIEQWDIHRLAHHQQHNSFPQFIVAPYPSYVHFRQEGAGAYHREIFSKRRRVFLFIAVGNRRSNPFRNTIIDLLPNRTSVSIKQYYSEHQYPPSMQLDTIRLVTPERDGPHVAATVEWMRESVFCLQPPGDSGTRKSIYDSILAGCIPVFFVAPYDPIITFPYQRVLDYSKFSVTIPGNMTEKYLSILEQYKNDTETVRALQKNLHRIMPLMQYSFPPDNKPHTDAMQIILDELGQTLGLQGNDTLEHYKNLTG